MNGQTSARSFVNGPNLLTAISLVAGFVALLLASQGEFVWAAGAVGVAAALDSVDGLLARRLGVCGPFGAQLDSLADMVAFGAAPALMLYLGALHEIPVAGVGACLAFMLSGAWRLARFPLIENAHRFLGLPIPPSGVIAATLTALFPIPGLVLAVTLVLTALMVSEVRFPTLWTVWRTLRARRRRREEAALVTEVRAVEPVGATPSRRRG